MLEQVVSIIVALLPILAVIVPFLYQLLVSKLPANQAYLIQEIVDAGVKSAEQAGNGMSGDEKKKIAVAAIEVLSSKFGIKLSEEAVSSLIEAAVFELNASKPPVSPPADGAFSVPPIPSA